MCCLRKYSLRTPDIKKRIAKYKPKNIRMSNKAWIIRIKFSITVQALMPLHFMSNSLLFVISDCSSSNEKRKIRCTAAAATLWTRWSLTPSLYWTSWALIGWMRMPCQHPWGASWMLCRLWVRYTRRKPWTLRYTVSFRRNSVLTWLRWRSCPYW